MSMVTATEGFGFIVVDKALLLEFDEAFMSEIQVTWFESYIGYVT